MTQKYRARRGCRLNRPFYMENFAWGVDGMGGTVG